MALPSPDLSSWICPGCGRRVPARIVECRCGSLRAVVAAPVPPSPQEEPARVRPVLLVGLGLVLGAALAVPAWSRLFPSPAHVNAPAAAAPSPAAAVAPPAERPAPDPPPVPDESDDDRSAPDPSLEDIVARVVPAVASIEAGQMRGTGFFVRHDALVTNAHVVTGHGSVRLQVGDASYTARVVTLSNASDLAILQVYNANPRQPTLPLGSIATARVGQEVIAVGSALGVLSNTVTRGIVSAVRRAGQVTLVQTDAAINPGNSGGPLVDRSGMVIGVNSMTIARHAGVGVAFAVAIDHVSHLLASGRPFAAGSPDSQTPLGGLEQMFGAPSESDARRARGQQAYAQVLEWAARQAEGLDSYWNRYASACATTASRTGDRPWFGVLEQNGVTINPTSGYDCATWLATLRDNAAPIASRIAAANAAARRDGVFPGMLRDLRRKYRLNWSGWD
jgi:hypothetical protein